MTRNAGIFGALSLVFSRFVPFYLKKAGCWPPFFGLRREAAESKLGQAYLRKTGEKHEKPKTKGQKMPDLLGDTGI